MSELSKLKNMATMEFEEIKAIFKDGFQLDDMKAILEKGITVLQKLVYFAEYADKFKGQGLGKQKLDFVVNFLDNQIKLPFYLEFLDQKIIRFFINLIVAKFNKKGWELPL